MAAIALPRTCNALVVDVTDDEPTLVLDKVPVPMPGKGQALIRVSEVAQNPTDVQSFDVNRFGDGAVLGCEFVGHVYALGPDVVRLRENDLVAGLVRGGEDKGIGAYSEYTIADENICFRVPDGMRNEEAATVPLDGCMAWLALFSELGLGIERESLTQKKEPILIWGASSSIGLYTLQIAALHGMETIATCDPRSYDLVRAHGAALVFDWHENDVVRKIRAAQPAIRYAIDASGNDDSLVSASYALVDGGNLCALRSRRSNIESKDESEDSIKRPRDDVKVIEAPPWAAFLKAHRHAGKSSFKPPSEEDHALVIEFFEKIGQWLQEGKIKAYPPELLDGGMDDVVDGFEDHRQGKIAGHKNVYKVQQTGD